MVSLPQLYNNTSMYFLYSTSLVIHGELVHIGYQKVGSEVLVMAVPANRVPMFLLDCIIKDVVRLLCFLFKSLDRWVFDVKFCQGGWGVMYVCGIFLLGVLSPYFVGRGEGNSPEENKFATSICLIRALFFLPKIVFIFKPLYDFILHD